MTSFIKLFLLFALCPHLFAGDAKPNFLIIYADDLGYGDVSTYHSSDCHTPNIDKLAAEGMLFRTCGRTARCARLHGPRCSPGAFQIVLGFRV